VALGYCRVCERLVPIRPKGYKYAGGRERLWYPVEHADQEGKPCDGDKKGI